MCQSLQSMVLSMVLRFALQFDCVVSPCMLCCMAHCTEVCNAWCCSSKLCAWERGCYRWALPWGAKQRCFQQKALISGANTSFRRLPSFPSTPPSPGVIPAHQHIKRPTRSRGATVRCSRDVGALLRHPSRHSGRKDTADVGWGKPLASPATRGWDTLPALR